MTWAMLAALALLAAPPQNEAQEALKALEQQDYQRAAQLLEKALEQDPEDFRGRFNLAFAYTELGQEEQAIAQYERVVEQQPDVAPARLNLGMLLMRRGRAADAVPHLETVAQARPKDFRAQFYYARALHQSNRAEDALAPYRQAVTLDPKSTDAVLELGQALAGLERFDEAAALYRQAAELDPQLAQMTLQLAEVLEKKNHTDKALALYEEYLAAHADAIAVRERVGFLLLQLKRYPQAIEVFEVAVRQNATAANQMALAEAYSLHDQPEKALTAWQGAVTAEPANPELRFRLANALLHQQSFREAGQQYLEAVQRNPQMVDAWNGLALSLYKVENYPGTLKALAEAEKHGPLKPGSIYLRAITEDKLQMYPEAKVSYERFLALNPGLEDEEWKSRQRLKVIEKVLNKRR